MLSCITVARLKMELPVCTELNLTEPAGLLAKLERKHAGFAVDHSNRPCEGAGFCAGCEFGD